MDNVDVVQRIYAAWAAKDLAAMADLIDPEVVITQDERLPWGGRYEGHAGFVEFSGKLTGTIASAVTTDALFAADDGVLQVGRTRGTVVATGAEFDVPEVHRWTVRDGRALTAHFAIDTPAMLEALAE